MLLAHEARENSDAAIVDSSGEPACSIYRRSSRDEVRWSLLGLVMGHVAVV